VRHLGRAAVQAAAEDEPVEAAARAHLAACRACRDEVDALRDVLVALRGDVAPEPSPLFWTHFSARVHGAVREEAARRPARRPVPWPPLRWWAPAGTLAAAVAAVLLLLRPPGPVSRPGAPAVAPEATVAGPTNEPSAQLDAAAGEASEDAWALVVAIAGTESWEADEASVARAGAAEEAVLGLSDTEQAELAKLLRRELGDPTI